MFNIIKSLFSAARITALKCLHFSDYGSWTGETMLLPDWEKRTKFLATFIPKGKSVLEFGAGRLTLKRYLESDCKYTPADLVDRGPGTLIVDLNKPLPIFPEHDVAVFGGVLEYVLDIPSLISKLSKYFKIVVLSYVSRDAVPRKIIRRSCGWVNDYSLAELENIFTQNGYICEKSDNWEEQRIYRFVQRTSSINL